MDVYQCLSCGERWLWGRRGEARLKKHGGHQVVVGDEAVLDRQCAELGLTITAPEGGEAGAIFRCMTCDWTHAQDMTEAAVAACEEHRAEHPTHRVLIGEPKTLKALPLDVQPVPLPFQGANPGDLDSKLHTGSVTFFGEGERIA